MSNIIQDALLASDDPFAPEDPKPEAQQWDNYQTHDLYCIDIEYLGVDGFPLPDPVRFAKFLAVEKATPYGVILCNFEAIALLYP